MSFKGKPHLEQDKTVGSVISSAHSENYANKAYGYIAQIDDRSYKHIVRTESGLRPALLIFIFFIFLT